MNTFFIINTMKETRSKTFLDEFYKFLYLMKTVNQNHPGQKAILNSDRWRNLVTVTVW